LCSTNPLAEFDGPLRGWAKREKRRKGARKKEGNGQKGWDKNTPSQNKFMPTAFMGPTHANK